MASNKLKTEDRESRKISNEKISNIKYKNKSDKRKQL